MLFGCPDALPMTDPYAPLRALFADAGYAFVEPAIVHDASVFVELAGEDLRRRLFLTNAADGRRDGAPAGLHDSGLPRTTSPAARRSAAPTTPISARCSASGRARPASSCRPASSRSGGPTASPPTPTCSSSPSTPSRSSASRARRCGSATRRSSPPCSTALDLDAPVAETARPRLRRPPRLALLIARAADGKREASAADAGVARRARSRAAVQRQVEDLLAADRPRPVGGRTPTRSPSASSRRRRSPPASASAPAAKCNRALPRDRRSRRRRRSRRCAPSPAPRRLDDRQGDRPLRAARRRLRRGAASTSTGSPSPPISAGGSTTTPASSSRFTTPTGRHRPIVGGGRYDRLLALIGAERRPVPAVGFSIWLDRIGARRDRAARPRHPVEGPAPGERRGASSPRRPRARPVRQRAELSRHGSPGSPMSRWPISRRPRSPARSAPAPSISASPAATRSRRRVPDFAAQGRSPPAARLRRVPTSWSPCRRRGSTWSPWRISTTSPPISARATGGGSTVATKYVNITRRFFAGHGIADYRIVESLGATEGAPATGAADLIVDITTTGATLRANGLKVLADGIVLRSQAYLVASRVAPWDRRQRKISSALLAQIASRPAQPADELPSSAGQNSPRRPAASRPGSRARP